ncbi:unnamed protein product (macronuclear) [Paramecium tetraurelia]|uniref:non-specific serine/threonine protein kinase n=1 Tax=Paramecium tetraurelia TaxID=5888 RepID=A0CYS8_PARTE|nr:uncharacterized protein GSPATT00011546001 [Paramecium tetraurelia]CAK75945.1 unnamed protein product [Paramecium tetraurelia]|eukprot:XP_001443342.1 hypothetical protein (macronuclear) [Paramecium tetraurelia strain d4-2]
MILFFLLMPLQIFAFTYQQQQQLNSDEVNQILDYNSGNIFDYELKQVIGEGAFSKVYLAQRIQDQELVVLKHINDTRESDINQEIQILQALIGLPNIVQMIDAIKGHQVEQADYYQQLLNKETQAIQAKQDPPHHNDSLDTTIIFTYQNTTRNLYHILKKRRYTLKQVKKYFKQIFSALVQAHDLHIMHRDIKVENVLVDQNDNIILIDWGLSQFYDSGKILSVRMGTRYYKAPELLLKYRKYDYSIDVWAVGCMLADFIFKTDPLFKGKDLKDQLRQIIQKLGKKDLYEYLKKYHIKLRLQDIPQVEERIDFKQLVNKKNKRWATKDAIDLLEKIFVYDHKLRINARQALEHAFFL